MRSAVDGGHAFHAVDAQPFCSHPLAKSLDQVRISEQRRVHRHELESLGQSIFHRVEPVDAAQKHQRQKERLFEGVRAEQSPAHDPKDPDRPAGVERR